MSESKRILVVASHPDDEVLGCGGTMAAHADVGDVVDVVIVVEGATSRDAKRDTGKQAKALSALQQSACDAAQVLGARKPHFLGLSDNRLDGMELIEVIKPIETLINELKPQVVYTQHGGDLNVDHRIVHQAVVTACRPAPGACVRAIYGYETSAYTLTVTLTEGATGTDAFEVTTPSEDSPAPTNGISHESSAVLAGEEAHFGPFSAESTALEVTLSGTGDADLFVRRDSAPTIANYDCRPYLSDSEEICTLDGPGTFYVMVSGYTDSTFDLSVAY